MIRTLCKDWADAHSFMQHLAKTNGLTELQLEGDNFGAPSIEDIAIDLVEKLGGKLPERKT